MHVFFAALGVVFVSLFQSGEAQSQAASRFEISARVGNVYGGDYLYRDPSQPEKVFYAVVGVNPKIDGFLVEMSAAGSEYPWKVEFGPIETSPGSPTPTPVAVLCQLPPRPPL